MKQIESTKPRKNILFIIHRLPYPLSSGGRQAVFNGILAIKDYYNVFVTYPEQKDIDLSNEKKHFLSLIGGSVKLLPYLVGGKKVSNQRNIVQRLSSKINSFLNEKPKVKPCNPYAYWVEELLPKPKPIIQHIQEIIKQEKIDIVQSEMLCNISFIHAIPHNVKTVFVHHELGFVRHELELGSRVSDDFDGNSYAMCSKNLEIGQLNNYDCVVTLSSIDKKKLIDSGVRTRIVDSFAIVDGKDYTNRITDWHCELSFVGPDNHEPNVVGLNWFLETCWDKLLLKDPRFHLTIIGKWTERNIVKITNRFNNISFAGFVDDLSEALRKTVMIVPITVGSGIRMKILEAANLGIPFISTTIGAEGIPLITGVHCLIADTPDEFILSIEKMKDDVFRNSIVNHANQMVRQHYSIEALCQNRLSIYQSLYEKE